MPSIGPPTPYGDVRMAARVVEEELHHRPTPPPLKKFDSY